MSRYFEIEITRVWDQTSFVRGLAIKRKDGAPLKVRGGQFLMVQINPDGEKLVRSYSVANQVPCDHICHEIELSVALIGDGPGTQMVKRAQPGTTWTVSGPHGRFIIRPDAPKKIVLVATGTGIAPYRSMIPKLEELLATGHEIALVMGARELEGFLYDSEFTELEALHAGFSYFRCASRIEDAALMSRPNDRCGRVQCVVDAMDLEDTVFYLCGNEHMVKELKTSLIERGAERKCVRTEAYVSP